MNNYLYMTRSGLGMLTPQGVSTQTTSVSICRTRRALASPKLFDVGINSSTQGGARLTLILILTFFIPFFAQAQNPVPLYNFTFDNDLNGWTTVGVSSLVQDSAKNALWVHSPDGTVLSGAYSVGLQIQSASGGGAALFDSDGLDNGGTVGNFGSGPAPSPQRSELISPSLDFSGEDKVLLAFHQYYRYFANNISDLETPNSYISVSNGTTDTLITLNENIRFNTSTAPDDVIVLDISNVAAGQAAVEVKFIWDGDYYFWLIDDVRFFRERGRDLAIFDYTTLSNFASPDFGIIDDTSDFEVGVFNQGDEDIFDSIEMIVQVLNPEGVTIFADTGYIDTLLMSSGVIWDFDRDWVPETLSPNNEETFYAVIYLVRCKGATAPEAITPNDNIAGEFFRISDFSFRKVPQGSGSGFNGQVGAGVYQDYAFLNYYKLSNKITESFTISNVSFQAFPGTEESLAGKNAFIYVVKLPDDVEEFNGFLLNGDAQLINFDYSMDISGMIDEGWVIGIGNYTFTAEDDNNDDRRFQAEVFDFIDGSSPVIIEPGSAVNAAGNTAKYFIVVEYRGSSSSIVQEVARNYKIWQNSTLAYFQQFERWVRVSSTTTLPAENIAVIDFELELVTVVDEHPLPENAVRIYPNPATTAINVEIALEQAADATIVIADVTGKVIRMELRKNIRTDKLVYNVEQYPAGTYLLRVSTRAGSRTERVMVVR